MATSIASTAAPAANSAAASVSTSASTSTGSDKQAIAGNFNDFLKLLTTQLRNQSPLDPLDTNQFTQQLVAFASVEQQLKTNDSLTALITNAKASSASTAAGFVGRQVTADGATAALAKGKAAWTINPARDVRQATITISDAKGMAVASQTRALTAGAQSFTWDGRTSAGLPAPEGDYTLAVTGLDAGGQPVAVSTNIAGPVDSVDVSGSEPMLLVGSARVPMSKVKSIGAGA
jgi:flagellar basal-body rod modification protein FlgD